MNPLPITALTRMQSGANDTMLDRCLIHRRMVGQPDRHGKAEITYIPDAEDMACGVKLARNYEGTAEALMADYVLRLPHGTDIDALDRVQLTQLFGNAGFSPIMCEIVGEVLYGATAVTLKLKRLTHGN